MTDLWQHSALELAELFRTGAASAGEIVDAHLARIDEVNGPINAVVRRIDDRARARARELDATRAAGDDLGPLAGVPLSIKDNIDLAGDATTQGVRALAEFVADVNSPAVERSLAAGAIPIARTNLPDLGLRVHTHSELHGLTRNPWNLDHTVGGSSGGEGAALATGMSALGLGNDIGGSLRNPATCCSIASIKPTTGRVAQALSGPLGTPTLINQILSVEGPMARRVSDVRAGLEIVSGTHPRDPWSAPVPVEVPEPSPKRVALIAEPPGGVTDPRVAEVARTAGKALAAAGHHVDEVEVPLYQEVLDCWSVLVVGSITAGLPLIEPFLGEDALKFVDPAAEIAAELPPGAIDMAWMQRAELLRAWNEFFAGWDAILTPTWTQLPFDHGYDLSPGGAIGALELVRPVMPANALGLPSAAVPAGMVDGLPVGVIATGPAWSDFACLEIAEAIESAGMAPATPISPRP